MRILIIDDERIQRITINDELMDIGYETEICASGQEALKLLKERSFDVILSDFKMPLMSGLQLLKEIKKNKYPGEFIIMTAFASIQNAVKAIRMGAYDYLVKPIEFEILFKTLKHIENVHNLNKENKYLRAQLEERLSFGKIIGKSETMQRVYYQITSIAPEDVSVLIIGETGTGKEIIADTIHHNSLRKNNPFVKVSCAALSREILESELFGHEKGAFTGAHQRKIGRFEMANGGTIYLDDVDDIPLDLQVKLLRVLQEQEIERVGGSKVIGVNVRVLASTKVDLKRLVDSGKFRSDLYYRLNVFPLELPPLRMRKDDIPLLLNHFLKEFTGREITVDSKTISIIMEHQWDGNVRELKNLAERLSVICKCDPIRPECLPLDMLEGHQRYYFTSSKKSSEFSLGEKVTRFENSLIREALLITNGNKAKAARLLGLPPSTLKTKLAKIDEVN